MAKDVGEDDDDNDGNDDDDRRDGSTTVHLVDGTLGLGGHTLHALSRGYDVRVLGIERDGSALSRARRRIENERFIVVVGLGEGEGTMEECVVVLRHSAIVVASVVPLRILRGRIPEIAVRTVLPPR